MRALTRPSAARAGVVVWALCLLLTALVTVPVGAQASTPAVTRVGWWVGGFAPNCPQGGCPHDYPEALWSALRQMHSFLEVGLTYTVDFGPGSSPTDLTALVRKAQSEGVEVAAWILAPASKGTFANENNSTYMRQEVAAFNTWRHTAHLSFSEATLDLELPAGYEPLTDLQSNPASLLQTHAPIDPGHQCTAIRDYRSTIVWARQRHLTLSGSPVPFAIDDLADGNMALADALDLAPLVPGYSHVYVQAYRTYSQAGADYVAHYFRRSRQLFGGAGEVSLGDTTLPGVYDNVDAIVQDVRMLAGMGATRIPIFNLEGSYAKFGTLGIQAIGMAVHQPMTRTEITSATAPNLMTTATLAFFGGLNTLASALSTNPNRYPPRC